MKKNILLLLAIFLYFWAMACYANQRIVLVLDWFPYPVHAPLFVGLDYGIFAAHGLDLEIVTPADPADPPKLVAAGKADVALTYGPQFIEQVDQGLPLIRIGTLVDQPLDCLVVLQNNSITKIADLKGKKIAYSVNNAANIALKTMLQQQGVTLKEVELINVHYDLVQALLTKKVDAITSIMRNLEVVQLQLMGRPISIFLPEQNGVPTYSELIFVAQTKNIHSPALVKFLIGLQQSLDYLQQHPYAAWEKFAKNHSQFNNEVYRKAWFASLPYFAKHPNCYNTKEWLAFSEFMQNNGLVRQVQPIDHYAIDLLRTCH